MWVDKRLMNMTSAPCKPPEASSLSRRLGTAGSQAGTDYTLRWLLPWETLKTQQEKRQSQLATTKSQITATWRYDTGHTGVPSRGTGRLRDIPTPSPRKPHSSPGARDTGPIHQPEVE